MAQLVQETDKFAEIYSMLRQHRDKNGVPVFNKDDWSFVVNTYDKKKVIEVLAHYIINDKPVFPLRKIEYKNMQKSFVNLWKRDILDLKVMQTNDDGSILFEGENYEVKLKYDYDCTSGGGGEKCLYAIQLGHEYNDASSYFQQENRLRCNSYGYKGPLNAWVDLEELKKMNWTFWRPSMVGKNGIRDRDYRSSMRVSGYVATQFKPHVAKAIYMINNAENILDTSCGWGDRLVAFYCSDCTKMYYGCDPNEYVYETYKKQCIAYEKLLGTEEDDIDFVEDFIMMRSKLIFLTAEQAYPLLRNKGGDTNEKSHLICQFIIDWWNMKKYPYNSTEMCYFGNFGDDPETKTFPPRLPNCSFLRGIRIPYPQKLK